MARKKADPLLEVLSFIRTASDEELRHIAAQATVELKAREPRSDEPRQKRTRKPVEAPVSA